MDKHARRQLRKIADHHARYDDFMMNLRKTRKRETEERNQEVDRQTLNACKVFHTEILTSLREYYKINITPHMLAFLRGRMTFGHWLRIPYTYVAIPDIDFLPCTHNRHPSDPQAIPVNVMVEEGVEDYKWRMIERLYGDFYMTMQNTAFLKEDLLREAQRQACIRACHAIKEELVARVFHPRNLERWIEQGVDEMMFGY
jgi:hypothetical protein